MVAFAVDTYGRLDGAHNNAGIEMVNKPIHELTAAEWQRCLDVDLTGVFYCMKHEFLAMKDSGGGSIVNTSSGAGIRGQVNAADYVAAKHGVQGLTKSAATEGGAFGIRVNSVNRSEEHTSELQPLLPNLYRLFCLKKKNYTHHI